MARHRTLVRLSRALRALAVVIASTAATTMLFEADIARALVMPSWKVATAPPVLYLTIALVALRHLPIDRRVGWALAACGINVMLAVASALMLSVAHPMSLEGALLRALWTYVPGPVIHLFAAPLVLVAWRSRVIPVRSTLRAVRAASPPVVRAPGPPLPRATPNWDAVLRPSTLPAWAGGPGSASFERAASEEEEKDFREPSPGRATAAVTPPIMVAAPMVAAPAPPSMPAPPPPPPPIAKTPPALMPPPVAKPAPPVSDEPMVRVPFARIVSQLPPGAFLLPPERLSESLQEPHVLLVPRRLVLPQLAEGAVDIAWPLIEAQFPELAFAAPPAEMRKRFKGWALSLPMDEVVRQMPPDLLRVEAPAADFSDIDQFPAPFMPGPPAPEPMAELEVAPASPAAAAASEPDPARVAAPLTLAAAAPLREPPPAPTIAPSAPAAPAPPAAVVEEPTREPEAAAPTAAEAVDEESESLARALALGLTPFGAFDWQARRVGGRPLVSFVPPTLAREAIDALAADAAALLDRLAPWAVEQVTIRTSRIACVLTPLGSRGCFAAAVRRNGPVAMLELLSARAGRATGSVAAVPAPGAALRPVPTAPAAGTGHRRLGEATRALAAFGPVASSVAAGDGAAPGVYVFAGRDDAMLAGVARMVHHALVAGHDQAALGRLESVELRRGRVRAVVRPLRGEAGTPAMLAAAGEVTLAGRAHRAAARAAALLEAR